MNKSVIFNDTLTTESIEAFINKLQKILEEPDVTVDVYFTSSGGHSSATYILLDFLHKFQSRITLTGVDALCSNGFNLFYAYKGKKRLLADVIGMLHTISFKAETRGLNNSNSLEVFELAEVTRTNQKYLRQYKSFLTEEEQRRFTIGECVILSSERMNNLFKTE